LLVNYILHEKFRNVKGFLAFAHWIDPLTRLAKDQPNKWSGRDIRNKMLTIPPILEEKLDNRCDSMYYGIGTDPNNAGFYNSDAQSAIGVKTVQKRIKGHLSSYKPGLLLGEYTNMVKIIGIDTRN